MKRTTIILIAIAVIFTFFIAFQIGSCKYGKYERELSELKGRYEVFKTEATEEREGLEEEMVQKEEKILSLKNEIIEIQAQEVQISEEIKVKDAEIERLKKEFSLIPAEEKDKQIFNLKLQVKGLEENIELITDSRDNYRQEAEKWAKAYETQVEITVKKVAIIKGLEKRAGAADAYIYSLEKGKKTLSFKFTLKNILYTGGAFLGGYLLGGLA